VAVTEAAAVDKGAGVDDELVAMRAGRSGEECVVADVVDCTIGTEVGSESDLVMLIRFGNAADSGVALVLTERSAAETV